MKILLINPPRNNEIKANNPQFVEEERGFNPPLGLLYIAAYLQKFTGHDVNVIDAQVERLSYDGLYTQISSIKPDVVGITAMTLTMIDVMKTVDIVKRINSVTKVVLGGPHIHLFPKETIELKGVDYLVLGEGEEVFKNLLDHIDDKKNLKTIAGLVFRENSETIYTGMTPQIENLDGLPFPARNLVPYKKYTSLLSKGENFTTIFTSRGCPFRCSFCARPHLGKRFRARSADNVVDELEECVRMGINEFLFYDDTFTVQKKRVLDVCNEIIKRKLNIGWDIRARVDTVDEEIIKHLKKAGCNGIHYGVESGSDKVLKALNKEITLEQVAQAFKLTQKYDIPILAYFMIGNPSETKDDINKTFELMKKLGPDYVHLTIFTPFPGTQIYDNGLKSGLIKEDYWRAFAMNPSPSFVAPPWGEVFNREGIEELLAEGYRKFYFRPTQLVKMAMKIRSISELYRKTKAGVSVFKMKY